MTDNPLDLDKLEAKLKATLGMTNHGEAERDRNIVKTGALLSIARSLEANKVPDHWEALEGPSGAILGWFDPQVARAIAQALGASQARQDDAAAPDALPVVVGATVALTAALALALDQGDPHLAGLGEVLDLGVTEGETYAYVQWDDEPGGDPVKVWVSDLTAIARAEVEPVSEAVAADWQQARDAFGDADDLESAHLRGDDLEPEGDIEVPDAADNSGFDIEPDDGAGDPAPEPEVNDAIDDIDADFDTVVEATPPADGLAALRKGKTAKG